MDGQEQPQVDGHAPLLEPAVLVSENCPECRGTGFKVVRAGIGEPPWIGRDPLKPDVPKNTTPCERCDGNGREVHEVPLSELVQLIQSVTKRTQPPSPSELRGGARA